MSSTSKRQTNKIKQRWKLVHFFSKVTSLELCAGGVKYTKKEALGLWSQMSNSAKDGFERTGVFQDQGEVGVGGCEQVKGNESTGGEVATGKGVKFEAIYVGGQVVERERIDWTRIQLPEGVVSEKRVDPNFGLVSIPELRKRLQEQHVEELQFLMYWTNLALAEPCHPIGSIAWELPDEYRCSHPGCANENYTPCPMCEESLCLEHGGFAKGGWGLSRRHEHCRGLTFACRCKDCVDVRSDVINHSRSKQV